MTVTVKKPFDAEERDKIFRFLYKIWSIEFQQDIPGANHDTRTVCDDLDSWARHFIAVDETGKVIGCMRNNHFSDGDPTWEIDQRQKIQKLCELFGQDKVAYTSHLALEPAARGKTVTSQLFFEGFHDAIASGTEVATCYAALSILVTRQSQDRVLHNRSASSRWHLADDQRNPHYECRWNRDAFPR